MEETHEQRIKLTDSVMDVVTKMSDRNPGAVGFIMQILTEGKEIDPQNMLGEIGPLLAADRIGIYGTDLYVLWSDLCNKDIILSVALLRATGLGILSSALLKDACSRQDYSGRDMINIGDVYTKVCEELSGFKKLEKTTV